LNPNDRALALENSEELEAVYSAVAVKGHTLAPNAQDDVDYHYVCFATSSSHHIYELDGDRKCPIDRGIIPPEDDMLSEDGLGILKEFIEEKGGNGFSLMALVSSHEPREQLGAGK
jgi:ubiquitin carboxyl-terminal hydrolase L3